MNVLKLFDLTGQAVLITGGSRGLGLQIAYTLGQAGARLALTARKQDELDQAAAELKAAGFEVMTVANDLAKVDTVPAMVDRVLDRFGSIDILINNAGATWGAPAEDYPRDAWEKVINLNLHGTWAVTQAVAKRTMIPRTKGVIITVASIAGLAGNRPDYIQTVAYNTSKAGLLNLTRTLAGEWGRYGIRANAIAPGFFPSKMSQGVLSRMGDRYLERVPLSRVGSDQDLMGTVLYLASNASSYVTGQTLVVDGGLTAVW